MQDFIPPAPKSKKRAVDEEVLWGYVPALDPRGLQRGLLHHGDPARLRRALHKLMSGQKTVVAAVGGSISVGRGSATQVRARQTMGGRGGRTQCSCPGWAMLLPAAPTTSRQAGAAAASAAAACWHMLCCWQLSFLLRP